MWPWGHAAVGYLLYSGALRVSSRAPPTDRATLLVLLGTQLPDLIDKPLSWGLGVFPTGYALGHSVFVALPVGVGLLVLARRGERGRVPAAFVVGYWSHLVADVVDPIRRGETPTVSRVLWPVVADAPYEEDLGLGRGLAYLDSFLNAASAMEPLALLVLYLLLPLATVGVWLLDGAPGPRAFTPWLRAVWIRLR